MEWFKEIIDALWENDPDVTGDQIESAKKALEQVNLLFKLPPRGKLLKLHGDVDSKVTLGDKEITLTLKIENTDENLVMANHARNLAICLVAVEIPQAEQLELTEDRDDGERPGQAHIVATPDDPEDDEPVEKKTRGRKRRT